jgi:hypothetical protein
MFARTRVRVCIPDRTWRMLGHYFESRCLPLIASEGRQLGARKDLDFAPVMMANTYAADLQPAARDYAMDRVSRTCFLSACRCGRLKEPAVAPKLLGREPRSVSEPLLMLLDRLASCEGSRGRNLVLDHENFQPERFKDCLEATSA